MTFNFKGGIHLEDKKTATYKKRIQEMEAPKKVIMPLLMHKGAMCSPIVSVGDHVKLGQKIAESTASFSAPIHSSVSGTVVEIAPHPHPNGGKVISVVIENDFLDEKEKDFEAFEHFQKIGAEELASIAREAGIVGHGGSAYPLSEKIKMSAGNVDTLIINGSECEPYITADNRMMIEYGNELYEAALMTAKAIGAKIAVVAIASNKPDAIAEMRRVLSKKPGVQLAVLHTKYPQGAERQVIASVTGREVPPGAVAADVGVMTMNVATAIALIRAVKNGQAVTTRVVTVSGSAVANPKNLRVRIGTTIKDVINACGGLLDDPEKVLVGGVMMGHSQYCLDTPVIKGTNGVLAFLPKEEKKKKNEGVESACIHCGKCASVCPMRLMPLYIHRAYKNDDIGECAEFFVEDCTECGCCSYVCPARIPLAAEMKVIKMCLEKNSESEEEQSGK